MRSLEDACCLTCLPILLSPQPRPFLSFLLYSSLFLRVISTFRGSQEKICHIAPPERPSSLRVSERRVVLQPLEPSPTSRASAPTTALSLKVWRVDLALHHRGDHTLLPLAGHRGDNYFGIVLTGFCDILRKERHCDSPEWQSSPDRDSVPLLANKGRSSHIFGSSAHATISVARSCEL